MITAIGTLLLAACSLTATTQLTGKWVGSWSLPGAPSHDFVLSMESPLAGEVVASAVSLSGGMHLQVLSDLTLKKAVVTFSSKRGEEPIRFRGRLDDERGNMAGTVVGGDPSRPGAFHLVRRTSVRSNPDHAIYRGEIPASAETLVPVTLHLDEADGEWSGEIDFPDAGILGYPIDVQKSERDDGIALMALPSPTGEVVTVALRPGDERMSGIWGRGQHLQTVEFVRDPDHSTGGSTISAEPSGWINHRVSVEAAGEETLHGILSVPTHSANHPLVILIGESGTDFNGTLEGHQILRVLTDVLTKAGFATLRLDQEHMGFVSRRRALRRWVNWAADQDQIDRLRIVLLGHGEGGSIAARHAAAFSNGVSGLVLLATPGLSERLNDLDRTEEALRASSSSNPNLAAAVDARRNFTQVVIQEASDDALRQSSMAWQRARSACLGSTSEPDDTLIETDIAQAHDADWLDRLRFNPRIVMPRLSKMPILAIQGDADARFDGPKNLAALVDANKSRGGLIESRLVPGMTHLLEPLSESEEVAGTPRTTPDPIVLDQVTLWLQNTIGRSNRDPRSEEGHP
ncbi:MAG: alpha/beta hydrolase [Planctomycetes bacterium]|nr:alpha/beta hydrolase [Planctomycetota bacterium]